MARPCARPFELGLRSKVPFPPEPSTRLRLVMSSEPSLLDALKHEECWPDWVRKGEVVVDDVSRLNATRVSRVYQVHSLDDLQRLVVAAKEKNQVVCVRGTKHSMGGHTMSKGAVVIDMAFVKEMNLNANGTVTVGTGAKWSDLIQYLNQFGKAPRTLQSYCSFSIGGTLSVNGHGVTTDFCVAESVVSFRLVRHDGSLIECSRTAESEEARELFKCVLGGYGLFGIVYDVTLRTNDNVRIFMDNMMVPLGELPHLYEGLAGANDIEAKLARINITNFELAEIYVFRRFCDTPTVGNLAIKPLEMSNTSRTLYKWFAGPLRELRFAVEQQLGIALDSGSEIVDRNLLLYESAEPLARLYSPILLVDDTFILQEYFVPRENFNSWIAEAKKIILNEVNHEKLLTLLNITIRVVEHDTDSMLPYSATPGGSFAFVLYYRLRRTSEAIQLLATYHNKLANITLAENGTFYLPYQHHYSNEQLLAAYPGFEHFVELKNKYDPESRFSNLWWEHYALSKPPLHVMTFQPIQKGEENALGSEMSEQKESDASTASTAAPSSSSPSSLTSSSSFDDGSVDLSLVVATTPLEDAELDALFAGVSTRRTDSFRGLMKDPMMRKQFMDIFLTEVFSIGNPTQVFRLINRAVWDVRQKDDDAIYMALHGWMEQSQGPISSLVKVWKSVQQVGEQKKELVREIVSVAARLGRFGRVHNMVSVGDHGKLVVRLRSAMKIKGHVWVVHDKQGEEGDIGAMLERGAANPESIGEFVNIDYEHIKKDGREFAAIPDGVVDLVTMNQGLHHLPPTQVRSFLMGVRRILRPGGLFITREHALDEKRTLIPMLDCAHMVFNVLTGVPPMTERSEIRGFRTIREWRTLVEACGFRDSLIYEEQKNDPTIDIMMTFIKVEDNHDTKSVPTLRESAKRRAKFMPAPASAEQLATLMNPLQESIQLLHLPPQFSKLAPTVALNQLPRIGLAAFKTMLQTLQEFLPTLQEFLNNAAAQFLPKDIPGLAESAGLLINNYLAPALMMLARFEPLTDAAVPNPDFAESYLPEEVYLIVQALRVRAKQGRTLELAIISVLDRVLKKFMKEDKPKKDSKPLPASAHAQSSSSSSSSASSSASLPRVGSENDLADIEQASPSALAAAAEISEDEVRNELKRLFEAYPPLSDLKKVISELGLSKNAASLLSGMAPQESTPETFTKFVLTKLDKYSWNIMREGLIQVRKNAEPLPTMDLINSASSGWHKVLSGIFSSSSIQFTGTQRFMAKYAGLGDIINIWSEAQEKREKAKAAADASGSKRANNRLPTPAVNVLSDLCPLEIYEGPATVLEGILSIASVRFVKASMTKLFNDKTEDVTESAKMALQKDGKLDLDEIELPTTLLRGTSKFVVEFRRLPNMSQSTSAVRKIGKQIGQLLASSGHLNSQLHVEHENLTFFKLSEWMQVEFVQIFGEFMHHTPWYRFPFIDMMKVYAQVLFKTVNVVAEKNGGGLLSALSEQGFMIDAVPGVVMALLFGQMQLLSLPVRASLGDSYNPDSLVEQLLVMAPGKFNWVQVDKRIVPLTEFEQGITVLQIPTFKPFTQVLTNIALYAPGVIILQISNYSVIHVKLEVEQTASDELKRQLATVKGVKVNFDFKFPSVITPAPANANSATPRGPVYVSLTVQVPALLNLIRRVHKEWKSAKIFQVYDFF